MYTKYEKHFLKAYKRSKVRYKTFPHHVGIVRHWAEKLCDKYPEADREAVIIASLFHDIGHFINISGENHAIISENEARRFLKKERAGEDLIEKVGHAIRSHRNADVKPLTLEAKIITFADSASHLTAPDVYLYVAAGRSGKKGALEKLERDFRDLSLFPDEKEKLKGLYVSWKKVLENFPPDFYPYVRSGEEVPEKHNI